MTIATIADSVVPGHTRSVKIAISVPDTIAEAVDAKAEELGISRSELYATAAAGYLETLEMASMKAVINELADELGGMDPESAWVLDVGRAMLAREVWDES